MRRMSSAIRKLGEKLAGASNAGQRERRSEIRRRSLSLKLD